MVDDLPLRSGNGEDLTGQIELVKTKRGNLHVEVVTRTGDDLFSAFNRLDKLSDETKSVISSKGWSDEVLQKLDDDLGSTSSELFRKLDQEVELVDSWNSVKDLPESVRRNTTNLESLSKAMKQDGYDADYFETLLKSKEDPQKFLNDYVNKIGDTGKFVDDALETDYTSYLARKSREGKPPRDRSDWNHTRDYMLNDSPLARGNNFNRKAWDEEWYPFWEVYLDNGKYLDGYNPLTKEVVSRKATELVDVSESTFRKYLDELIEKYAPPRVIKSQKPGYEILCDQPIPSDAKLILEIPEYNRSFFDLDRYSQIASEKGITIKFAPE